ncbi:hypothetical protein [Aquimarina litoralis]|uniref:hypothetical protein n=1 Tax=Aquimarina litoralis TaxID=584605 RepID=UPI001C56B9A9|nr:hypothetical protein [Aquimarina litoralis]MBW1298832.1 hypothetical protein [Aquimarina litoralis]
MYASKNKLISRYKGLNLYQIRKQSLTSFSDFVFRLYSYHYTKKYNWQPEDQVQLDMKASDEKRFYQSIYFAFINDKEEIVGTIKLTYRLEGDIFPIEEEFDIDLSDVIAQRNLSTKHIWHLGRLAIDSKLLKEEKHQLTAKELISELVRQAFQIVDKNPDSLVIAESDALIYTIFREIGINMQKIGPSQECLGSPTYPVIMTGEDIHYWLNDTENKKMSKVYK